jgi:hypothetical protein
VYNFSISQEMLENVGIVVLVFSLSFAIVVFSIVIFLHNFSCNINCNLSNKKVQDEQRLDLMKEMLVKKNENTTTVIFN